MSMLSARQRLTASNIANADTPGYKTKDIDFNNQFHDAIAASPQAVEVEGLAVKNDGNNINLDREAKALAENAIRFNLASHLLQGQIRAVRSAIQEGRNG